MLSIDRILTSRPAAPAVAAPIRAGTAQALAMHDYAPTLAESVDASAVYAMALRRIHDRVVTELTGAGNALNSGALSAVRS